MNLFLNTQKGTRKGSLEDCIGKNDNKIKKLEEKIYNAILPSINIFTQDLNNFFSDVLGENGEMPFSKNEKMLSEPEFFANECSKPSTTSTNAYRIVSRNIISILEDKRLYCFEATFGIELYSQFFEKYFHKDSIKESVQNFAIPLVTSICSYVEDKNCSSWYYIDEKIEGLLNDNSKEKLEKMKKIEGLKAKVSEINNPLIYYGTEKNGFLHQFITRDHLRKTNRYRNGTKEIRVKTEYITQKGRKRAMPKKEGVLKVYFNLKPYEIKN